MTPQRVQEILERVEKMRDAEKRPTIEEFIRVAEDVPALCAEVQKMWDIAVDKSRSHLQAEKRADAAWAEIERTRQAQEAAHEDAERANGLLVDCQKWMDHHNERANKAEARGDRLRAELEKIKEHPVRLVDDEEALCECVDGMRGIAREALKQGE